jgi:hypothetical protein
LLDMNNSREEFDLVAMAVRLHDIGHWGAGYERLAPKLGASSMSELLIPIVTDPNGGWRDPGDTVARQLLTRISRQRPSSSKYEAIDQTLREIAEAKPKSQEEVFKQLDGRVDWPNAEPFASAKGWIAGFEKDRARARIWLSKRWSLLRLPPFVPGPKPRPR